MPSLWSRMRGKSASYPEVTLDDLTSNYDIRYVEDTPGHEFAIVTSKSALRPSNARELGSSSPSPFTSFVRKEYNPALQGLAGLEVFDKMRRSDGTVRGTLRGIKIPALAGRWFVEAAQAGEYGPGEEALTELEKEQYKEIADFIWRNLTEMMSITWPQLLTEALLMCDFGYYIFEKVWENRMVDGTMRTVLVKLAPRHPMDVKEWHYDANGGPVGVTMYVETTEANPLGEQFIGIDKLLVFTFDREAGNIEGISVLRSAYKHWYYKEQLYKIDAIQKERHGIGIPVIKLPMGFSEEDKKIAEELGRNIRTNERAHIVLPPSWDILMLKLEGQLTDALSSIEHHNEAIRENILFNFTGDAGEEDMDLFLKASRFVADIVAATFNGYLINQMVGYNWPLVEKLPKLRVRRIGESNDQRTLSFTVRNLVGAGVIIPDARLEAHIRRELDLPEADPSTARQVMTPQGAPDPQEEQPVSKRARSSKNRGARAGMPRQSRPSAGVPAGNAGTDRSGR